MHASVCPCVTRPSQMLWLFHCCAAATALQSLLVLDAGIGWLGGCHSMLCFQVIWFTLPSWQGQGWRGQGCKYMLCLQFVNLHAACPQSVFSMWHASPQCGGAGAGYQFCWNKRSLAVTHCIWGGPSRYVSKQYVACCCKMYCHPCNSFYCIDTMTARAAPGAEHPGGSPAASADEQLRINYHVHFPCFMIPPMDGCCLPSGKCHYTQRVMLFTLAAVFRRHKP